MVSQPNSWITSTIKYSKQHPQFNSQQNMQLRLFTTKVEQLNMQKRQTNRQWHRLAKADKWYNEMHKQKTAVLIHVKFIKQQDKDEV